MNPLTAQQCALDEALVTTNDRVIIEKRNMRINPTNEPKEATYQVVLDSLKQTTCYKAFFTTTDVPEIYMHQFWSTINKITDSSSYRFKLNKKRFKVDVEVFRKVLQIFPRIHNQEFVEPPNHEEIVAFIKELGYRGELESILSCLLITFTKVIIRHFMSKDKTISVRNSLFIHGVEDDSVLGFLKFISKYEIRQVYSKLIPDVLVSRVMLELKAYQNYLDYPTGKVIPKESRKRTKAHISSLTANDDIISENPDDAWVNPPQFTHQRLLEAFSSDNPLTQGNDTLAIRVKVDLFQGTRSKD
ncbi:hypothetical protein Tco_0781563 [Tanacetum coccineum]